MTSSDPVVMKNFYTALYHSMIAPFAYQDVDGRYLGMDKQVHTAEAGYTNYTVFSLWDTFRALHPLMTIIDPALAADWGKVMVHGYKEGGILPKWPLTSSYTVAWWAILPHRYWPILFRRDWQKEIFPFGQKQPHARLSTEKIWQRNLKERASLI